MAETDDQRSDRDTVRRRDAALRRALNTPPLPLEIGLKTALGAPRRAVEGISRMGGDQPIAMQANLGL